jgi:putative proteasome-type protease
MTYCLGIKTRDGLVLAADSRTNAGLDQVNTCRKLHVLAEPGELTSGGLSLSQSVLTLLTRDFDEGLGLARVSTFYEAARQVGAKVRKWPTRTAAPWSATTSPSMSM